MIVIKSKPDDALIQSQRFIYFLKAADRAVAQLPHGHFHLTIDRALLGVYLADPKVNAQKNVKIIARKILLCCGGSAFFFMCNTCTRVPPRVGGAYRR